MKYITFQNFNAETHYNRYFVTFNENTFIFVVRWNSYGEHATLSIYDYNNVPIIMGKALVNNLIIRNNKLPYIFYFIQKNGETYEPTIENIASEFVLAYEEGE